MQWPTNGRIGCITPAIWEVANASEWGTKSAVAQKWADWLHNPCCLGGVPNASEQGQNEQWATNWHFFTKSFYLMERIFCIFVFFVSPLLRRKKIYPSTK